MTHPPPLGNEFGLDVGLFLDRLPRDALPAADDAVVHLPDLDFSVAVGQHKVLAVFIPGQCGDIRAVRSGWKRREGLKRKEIYFFFLF